MLWTPLALALAMLCPAALFYFDGEVSRIALAMGAFELGLALLTLGLSWKLTQAPRSRRIVVMHVIAAALVAAVAAPFVLGMAPAILAGRHAITPAAALALMPLSLMLELPAALISSLVFAWIALAPGRGALRDMRHQIQPFQ